MLKITDFSKIAQVSTRTLRYYDTIGLLKPQLSDPATRYRYYALEQLARLNRILALKDLGFGLEQIAALIDTDLTSLQMHSYLLAQEQELEQRMLADAERLQRVRRRLQQIEAEDAPLLIDVVLKAVEAQHAVGNRMIIPTQMDLMFFCTHMLAEVYRWLKQHHIAYQPPQLILYHAQEYIERDYDTEVVVLLPSLPDVLPPLPHAAMRIFELPAVPLMATTIYQGPLRDAGQTTRNLVRWAEQQGYGYPEEGLMLRELHLFEYLDATRPIAQAGTVEFQLPVVSQRS